MSDYVDSQDSTHRFRIIKETTAVWGLQVYDWLTEEISGLPRHSELGLSGDLVNSFRVLWEHKKCMVARIQYLCKHGHLQEEKASCDVYADIERRMNKVRLVMMRWSISRRDGTLERVKSWIQEIAELESEVLRATIKQLRSSSSLQQTTMNI